MYNDYLYKAAQAVCESCDKFDGQDCSIGEDPSTCGQVSKAAQDAVCGHCRNFVAKSGLCKLSADPSYCGKSTISMAGGAVAGGANASMCGHCANFTGDGCQAGLSPLNCSNSTITAIASPGLCKGCDSLSSASLMKILTAV